MSSLIEDSQILISPAFHLLLHVVLVDIWRKFGFTEKCNWKREYFNSLFRYYGYQTDTTKKLTGDNSLNVGCNVESESTSINFSYSTE